MDDIKDIIQSIVKGCAHGGLQVSEILAAYVARTVVENDASSFALDKNMTSARKDEVILRSIQKLLERDNPSLEVIKMQVEFDASYLQEENEAQQKLKQRTKLINHHKQAIANIKMEDSTDYDALTILYRKLFRFLLEFVPNTKPADQIVEREVAAALESVFPRVGLKTFIQLTYDEKLAQMVELARIVLGIRLFNRDEGRGGAGINDMDKDSVLLSNVLVQDLEKEIEFFSDAINKYQKAIIRAHVYRRKKKFLVREEEKKRKKEEAENEHTGITVSSSASHHRIRPGEIMLISQLDDVNDYVIERWSQELANRRQYLTFLRTLYDEAHFLQQKVHNINDKIRLELATIKSLVSNKSSVPKETVYPRFDALGGLWLDLYDEVVFMISRSNVFQTLCKYRLSFSPTLAEEMIGNDDEVAPGVGNNSNNVSAANSVSNTAQNSFIVPNSARKARADNMSFAASMMSMMEEEEENNMNTGNMTGADAKTRQASKKFNSESKGDYKGDKSENGISTDNYSSNNANYEEGRTIDDMMMEFDDALTLPQTPAHLDNKEAEYGASSAVQLLSVENTPDFLMLPLELQGYCPWTIVQAKGLLVPGKPSLGIVCYENLYYVFDHAMALKAFMKKPEYFLNAIRGRALHNPEFIHLLRLHRWFPTVSISKLLQRNAESSNSTGTINGAQPLKKDAATETPTHFIDTYIDLNYHWNEWELRRRALKIVNLQHCKTTSQQTDLSHYKRDNESQVFLPKEQGTQTKREKGTNPPIVTTYVEGLRGKVAVKEADAKGTSTRDDDKEYKTRKITNPKVSVVKMTLDL